MYKCTVRILGWLLFIMTWIVAAEAGELDISNAIQLSMLMVVSAIMIK